MSLNNVNGVQPRLLTFAEMGYAPQAPQAQAPAVPEGTDVADLSNKPKKKVSKGVIAAVVTVAAAALAAIGLAAAGKKASGAERLFTKANFTAGFEELKALPGKLIAMFKNKGEAPAPAPAPAPAFEPPAADV